MTERAAFLRAICEHPSEDMPRLAFADWLEEFGGEPERAEFIRVQCEKERVPGCRQRSMPQELQFADGTVEYVNGPACGQCENCVRVFALVRRERELLKFPKWREWFPQFKDVSTTDMSWYRGEFVIGQVRRGFVSAVTCTAANWLTHADAIHWHPGQTVKCERCKGSSPEWKHRQPGAGMYDVCERCMNKGTVPRPIPETAQPVRKVTFTTRPEDVWIRGRNGIGGHWQIGNRPERWIEERAQPQRYHDHPLRGAMEIEFPGVEFELPPVPLVTPTDFQYAGSLQGMVDAQLQSIVQAFALPPHLAGPPS